MKLNIVIIVFCIITVGCEKDKSIRFKGIHLAEIKIGCSGAPSICQNRLDSTFIDMIEIIKEDQSLRIEHRNNNTTELMDIDTNYNEQNRVRYLWRGFNGHTYSYLVFDCSTDSFFFNSSNGGQAASIYWNAKGLKVN